jgi:hypothetical protein
MSFPWTKLPLKPPLAAIKTRHDQSPDRSLDQALDQSLFLWTLGRPKNWTASLDRTAGPHGWTARRR